jgi:hypothetical protein
VPFTARVAKPFLTARSPNWGNAGFGRPGRAEIAAQKKLCPVSLAVLIELVGREGG